jgi:hypothetical protein
MRERAGKQRRDGQRREREPAGAPEAWDEDTRARTKADKNKGNRLDVSA